MKNIEIFQKYYIPKLHCDLTDNLEVRALRRDGKNLEKDSWGNVCVYIIIYTYDMPGTDAGRCSVSSCWSFSIVEVLVEASAQLNSP